MIDSIYIENDVAQHPRAKKILRRYPNVDIIHIDRYGEVFNRRSQNFRLQKQKPALILAKKHDHFVLPSPVGYGVENAQNFYFSHMLNCVYDCRYCFLQGMYPSANYVLFVNYEDFGHAITTKSNEHAFSYFFSGYDCDSLAFDAVTEFIDFAIPFFHDLPTAFLELRTKSAYVRPLLEKAPPENVIVAFSMNPESIAERYEHGAPSMSRRIEAIRAVMAHGYKVGLRFDPILYCRDFYKEYGSFFEQLFSQMDGTAIHSISLGAMRFPKAMFDQIVSLYPDESLFAGPLVRNRVVTYKSTLEQAMQSFCEEKLQHYAPHALRFSCTAE